MNPDLEPFLQETFGNIEPIGASIARVVVEPDYESGSIDADPGELRAQLIELLREQSPDATQIAAHTGVEVHVPSRYQALSRSVRRVVLHGDREEGPWIEVAPPGYWI